MLQPSSKGQKIFAGACQFAEHDNETQPAIPYSKYCLLEEGGRQWSLRT